MSTQLLSELKVTIRDSSRLEMYLRMYGFKYNLHYIDGKHAIVVFDTEEDATAFVLKGILEKMQDYNVFYSPEPEFEFMIRLEKKLKTYSPADEYFIRKAAKGT